MSGIPKRCAMSKARYALLKEVITDTCTPQQAEHLLTSLQEIMEFDPEASTYSPEKKKQIMDSRNKRAKELGVSTYVVNGARAHYHRKKALRDAQNLATTAGNDA